MAAADVGDDVLDGDPTVAKLETELAQRLGHEAAVFTPSATMSNLLAVMSHCRRGDEYIAGQQAHLYKWEAGGAAVLGSVQPQPIPNQADGTLDLDEVEATIKPDDPHFARTALVCFENTWWGRALPLDYGANLRDVADRHGLAVHLDGARLFNAAVDGGVDVSQLASAADSVTICLSKGLGAPVGAVLAGNADLVAAARRTRKMVGGGMRQSGVVAAAGLYALDHNIDRLADDHERAKALASGLADRCSGADGLFTVTGHATNMVFAHVKAKHAADLVKFASDHNVRLLAGSGGDVRMVCHLDISDTDVSWVSEIIGRWVDSHDGLVDSPA